MRLWSFAFPLTPSRSSLCLALLLLCTWSRPVVGSMKYEFVEEIDTDQSIARMARKMNTTQVSKEELETIELCFYLRQWITDPKMTDSECHQLFGSKQTKHDQHLVRRVVFKMFIVRDRKDKALVKECFFKYRFAHVRACKGITWAIHMHNLEWSKKPIDWRQEMKEYYLKELRFNHRGDSHKYGEEQELEQTEPVGTEDEIYSN